MGTKMKLFVATARDFLRSKRGNVAMMFGVMMLPLMMGAAAGLDFTRAMLVRQQMGEALDAAALAVGSTSGLDQAKAQALAQKYFDANYTVDKTEFGTPTISIPTSGYDANGSVQITATNTMPTVLMRIAGITSLPLSTSSNVVWGQTKLWVALVLDNSGSMDDSDAGGTKIAALKNGVTGTDQLLDILEKASTNPGDVQVGIVPFSGTLNMSSVGTADIDWGEWDAPPKAPGVTAAYAVPNPRFSTPATISFEAWGPGDSCPFYNSSNNTMSPFGFECRSSGANTGTSKINKIATSGATKGLICPGIDPGTYNGDHHNRYYNGCYTSTAGTGTVQIAKGSSATCQNSSGFGFSSSNCSCSGSGSSKTCNTKKWVHTWVPNNHSTWSGCVMDRQRSGIQTMTTTGLRPAAAMSYDTSNVQPSSGTPDSQFPAENPKSCLSASITTLGYNWSALKTTVNAMVPKGSTNQAIGVAHGWQMLTPGAPYSTPAVPANTTRYMIIFSDGLNTKDRWWGDGSTTGTTEDGYIDDYEKATCDAAKADGVVIYAIFLDIAGGDSAPLKYCASDPSKYFELSSTTTVSATFKQIAQQITNVRVMK